MFTVKRIFQKTLTRSRVGIAIPLHKAQGLAHPAWDLLTLPAGFEPSTSRLRDSVLVHRVANFTYTKEPDAYLRQYNKILDLTCATLSFWIFIAVLKTTFQEPSSENVYTRCGRKVIRYSPQEVELVRGMLDRPVWC
jgi:hypothetical protein